MPLTPHSDRPHTSPGEHSFARTACRELERRTKHGKLRPMREPRWWEKLLGRG